MFWDEYRAFANNSLWRCIPNLFLWEDLIQVARWICGSGLLCFGSCDCLPLRQVPGKNLLFRISWIATPFKIKCAVMVFCYYCFSSGSPFHHFFVKLHKRKRKNQLLLPDDASGKCRYAGDCFKWGFGFFLYLLGDHVLECISAYKL
ncbi:hypothetical protein ES703_39474 [subsurface metagenome]